MSNRTAIKWIQTTWNASWRRYSDFWLFAALVVTILLIVKIGQPYLALWLVPVTVALPFTLFPGLSGTWIRIVEQRAGTLVTLIGSVSGVALLGLAVVPTFLETDLAKTLKDLGFLANLIGFPFYFLVLAAAVGAWGLLGVAVVMAFPDAPGLLRRGAASVAVGLAVTSPLFFSLATHQIVHITQVQF